MANYFIFGIGGTGSRVIRSLTMLLGAGFQPFKSNDKVFPILIDYDTENGDTLRTKKLIDCYHSIHASTYPDGVFNEEKCNGLFFSTPMLEMWEANPAAKSGFAMQFGTDNKQTFEQWTAMSQLLDGKRHTADLMNSLYDDSSDDNCAELKLKMDVGFKGNPNIGSIVFHSLKETREFNDFASMCQDGDKVIIVGSLFGGTGSSGIPEMVQAIRTNSKTEVRNVDLSVVMVCPYFGFRSSDEKAVRSSIFNSKTKAALNFYETSGLNEMINAIYYVGDDRTSIYEYCEGGNDQRNKIHIVDFVSALSICHFAENGHGKFNRENNKVEHPATQYFKYRLAELTDDELQVATNDDNTNIDAHGLNFTNLMDTELDHMFFPLASFALALRFFHDEVALGTKAVKELDWYLTLNIKTCFENGKALTAETSDKLYNDLRYTCDGLMSFYDLFVLWNEEFKQHSTHSLYMFDFEKQLYDFIVDGSLKIKESRWKSTELLKAEDDVAECTKNTWKEMKAVNSFSVDSKYAAFMLMKVLTQGSREVFKSDKNDRTVKRRKELTGKTIKVALDAAAE